MNILLDSFSDIGEEIMHSNTGDLNIESSPRNRRDQYYVQHIL